MSSNKENLQHKLVNTNLAQKLKDDSLKKRYVAKLAASLFGAGVGVASQAIIPRGLGPKLYGDFNFLRNFFQQIVGFFDSGTSLAFYTKLSKRPTEKGLLVFYVTFVAIVSVGVIGVAGLAHLNWVRTVLWKDQVVLYIYLAAGLGILIWLVQILGRIADAYGVTVPAEFARAFQKFFGLVFIFLLFIFSKITFASFFAYNYLLLILLVALLAKVIRRTGDTSSHKSALSVQQSAKKYTREFYAYSHPLILYALVGTAVGIFDRWMLQVYGGSVQQGFYEFAYQVGAICFLFAGTMTPLLTREFSIAFEKENIQKMAQLFQRYIPLFYSLTIFFAAFVVVQGGKIALLFGGDKFSQAAFVVTIMAFYPIHQTYGQLSGSVFYATGQTKLYRNIGIGFLVLGIPLTYVFVGPLENFGLHLGAVGLAFKVVLIQFAVVNVQLYFNSRFLKLSFWKFLAHQLIIPLLFLGMAQASVLLVYTFANFVQNFIFSFLASGLLYTAFTFAIVWFYPFVFGLQRGGLRPLRELFTKNNNGIEFYE